MLNYKCDSSQQWECFGPKKKKCRFLSFVLSGCWNLFLQGSVTCRAICCFRHNFLFLDFLSINYTGTIKFVSECHTLSFTFFYIRHCIFMTSSSYTIHEGIPHSLHFSLDIVFINNQVVEKSSIYEQMFPSTEACSSPPWPRVALSLNPSFRSRGAGRGSGSCGT